jgi:hypothetical protein
MQFQKTIQRRISLCYQQSWPPIHVQYSVLFTMKSYLLSTFILASLALLATTSPIPDSHPVHIESRAGEQDKKHERLKELALARARKDSKSDNDSHYKTLLHLEALSASTHSEKEGVSNKSPFISAILISNILDRCLCRELRGLVIRG